MNTRLIVCSVAGAAWLSASGNALQTERSAVPREARIQAGKASLYAREIGRGQPLIVLHGGPDFDHRYLLPDLDRLAAAFRLIYYDCGGGS
jgi:proline iminopeptidase